MEEMIRKIDATKYEVLKKEVVNIQDLEFRQQVLRQNIINLQKQLDQVQQELAEVEEQIAIYNGTSSSEFVPVEEVKAQVLQAKANLDLGTVKGEIK